MIPEFLRTTIGPCRGRDEDAGEVVSPGQVELHSPAEHAQRDLEQHATLNAVRLNCVVM